MNASKLKINFFGEAISYKKVQATNDQLEKWKTIANRMKSDFPFALVDPYFYHLLKDNNIQSSNDLVGETTQILLNTTKNQIEIWFKNKKVQKLKMNDLIDDFLFFPLYKTLKSKSISQNESGIYIEQKEIGLIGSYELMVDNFNIYNLIFQLSEINGELCLSSVSYAQQNFKLTKSDSIILYQNCFMVKD
jgi:hypothetical protein